MKNILFILLFSSLLFGQRTQKGIDGNLGVFGIDISQNNPVFVVTQYIYAGTSANGVYRSSDNGLSWTQTGLATGEVKGITVSGNNIFAATYANDVQVSTNNGLTWTSMNVNGYNYSVAANVNNIFIGIV